MASSAAIVDALVTETDLAIDAGCVDAIGDTPLHCAASGINRDGNIPTNALQFKTDFQLEVSKASEMDSARQAGSDKFVCIPSAILDHVWITR